MRTATSFLTVLFLSFTLTTLLLVITARPTAPPEEELAAVTDRRAESVERLKVRLVNPDSMIVRRVTNIPPFVVEVDFTAKGSDGLDRRSRFCVRWVGDVAEDILPETTDGTLDDPYGLFKR